ncbi:hypothetical protein [Thermovibrio sp.]
MKEYKRLLKCSTCGSVGEFTYVGSRNVNEKGEVKEIVGDKEMWISYFKCPYCGSIEVEFHPVGEKPDVPKESFKEVKGNEE